MIKYVVILTKIIIITLITILFSSCKSNIDFGDGIDGTGNVTIEKRDLSQAFTKINANRGLEVILTQSTESKVEVEADQNLLEHISTKVENGVLILTTDKNIESAEKLIVRVQMPIIESLTSSSGSKINTNNTIKGKFIKIDSSSGSVIEAILEYEEIRSSTSSGSTINMSGKALALYTDASSGSEINAETIEANLVHAEASSGSSIKANPLQELKASASSGATIEYETKPAIINIDESSGGTVSLR